MRSMRYGWVVVGLVLLALGLRVGMAVSKGVGRAPEPGTDQYEYDTYAWNVAQGRGYRGPTPDVADQDHLTAYRPPGPSVMFAGVYAAVGHRYAAARLANCLLSALTVAVVYGIGARAYGRGVGVLAAAGYAVWPTAITYSTDLLSEPLGTFLFLMALLMGLKFAAGGRRAWGWAAVSGVFLGAAVMTRANFTFMIPLTAVWAVWVGWGAGRRGRAESGASAVPEEALTLPSPGVPGEGKRGAMRVAAGLLVPALAVVVMAPWAVRNYGLFHAFIPVSTGGGSGLLQGNNRIVAAPGPLHGYSVWDTKIPEYAEALRSAGDEVERDRRAKELAVRWIKDNPGTWVRLEGAKLVRGWTPVLQPNVPRVFRVAQLATWGVVLVLFPWAFVVTLAQGVWRRDGAVLLHLAIANALIINLIFWGETRYRHGIEPLCLIWAALTVVWVAGRLGWGRGEGADEGEAVVASGRVVGS